ncbi:DUF411 domain-containing protein [Marinibaculum pumilum]|uniref:DUF411 domain-containing protein n=1 Tax=Marinibaculum pumilum TaxID=1766165 RepID=A0ABV7KZ16_9PROT
MRRRRFLMLAGAVATLPAAWLSFPAPSSAGMPVLEVYKTPWCGCCGAWVEHMRMAGFASRVTEQEDLQPLKARLGVPPALQSCHTALADGYVVEGHVPAADVARLLRLRPDAFGLAVPGMPIGSPGMETGAPAQRYDVILFSARGEEVFARH